MAYEEIPPPTKPTLKIYYGDSVQIETVDQYAKFYYWLSEFKELEPADMLIYSIIADFESMPNGFGYCGLSNQSLGEIIHLSRKYVGKRIDKLVQMGLITKELCHMVIKKNDGSMYHVYQKLRTKPCNKSVSHNNPPSQNDSVSQNDTGQSVKMTRGTESKRLTIQSTEYTENICANAPGAMSANVQPADKKSESTTTKTDDLFSKFWTAYPKKKDKRRAEKAFKKIKNLEAAFPVLMKALEVQKQSRQWQKNGGQYIPHPTTWINGERWNDEPGPCSSQFQHEEQVTAVSEEERRAQDEEAARILEEADADYKAGHW